MCEKEKDQEVNVENEEEELITEEKDLISMYVLKKFQFYLISFTLFLGIMGGLIYLLPEETNILRETIFEFDYLALVVILGSYSFFSFGEKASEVDLTRISGLYFYTLVTICFSLPKLELSLDYLDLSITEDFFRLASSGFLVLLGYPLIYFLGEGLFKRNLTIEEWKEIKREEQEEKEKKEIEK